MIFSRLALSLLRQAKREPFIRNMLFGQILSVCWVGKLMLGILKALFFFKI